MGESIFDRSGNRKYLTQEEKNAFLKAAEDVDDEVRTFCTVLVFTGCRISEALNLTTDRVDLVGGFIIFESLKKRKKGVFRAVPVPPHLLETLDIVHSIRQTEGAREENKKIKIWNWSRVTGWRRVKEILAAAGIGKSFKASPKSLRHGFGVSAVSVGIPLNLVQKWLGHAQLSTTAIYADAIGPEEKNIASKMW